MMTGAFTPEELARRRAGSRKLAWVLAGAALLLYVAGMFVAR